MPPWAYHNPILNLRPFLCGDCGGDPVPMFVVHDELWFSVAKRKELLCVGCFEKRLGRRLLGSDLKECGITRELRLGFEILSRPEPAK